MCAQMAASVLKIKCPTLPVVEGKYYLAVEFERAPRWQTRRYQMYLYERGGRWVVETNRGGEYVAWSSSKGVLAPNHASGTGQTVARYPTWTS